MPLQSEMASNCDRETRVWYSNSTRTSISYNDGNGLKVVSPRMSAEQNDHEWYYTAFPPGMFINYPSSLRR